MKWLSLCLACLISTAAFAQTSTIERTFKGRPETDIRVGIFASFHRNCTAAPPPVIRLITPPAHGKVTVKQAHLRATNLKQCLGVDTPAFVAIYRSRRDFIGQDVFTLEVIGAKGKSQFQRITVTVMKPGSGQGI
jgi:hypothetical protein